MSILMIEDGKETEYVDLLDASKKILANIEFLHKKKTTTQAEISDTIQKAIDCLNSYTLMHEECIRQAKNLEDRRRDHWDILKEKCESDPMFKEQWDELMVLLRLEQ